MLGAWSGHTVALGAVGAQGRPWHSKKRTQPGLVLTWAVFSPSDRRTADCCSGPTTEGHLCHPASP